MAGGKPWTRLEEQRAVALRAERLTHAAIARRLGRTRRSVAQRLCLLGATDHAAGPRRKPGELMAAVRRLCRRYEDWEAGYVLGVSQRAVAQARKRAGVPAKNQAQAARARAKYAEESPCGSSTR